MDEYGIALRHVENDARNGIWLNECTVRFDDGEGVVVDGETNRREGPCVYEADSVPFCPGSVSGLAHWKSEWCTHVLSGSTVNCGLGHQGCVFGFGPRALTLK